MKRLLSILLIIGILFPFFKVEAYSGSDEGYFIVTAYYSPLPNQKYYLTGDYESEKRLNGEGIAGASGKGVFSGMLAAPKNYRFGTKIHLEGLGIGEVSDRGGAIVNAGNRGYSHDRIDVWMGYGEEGLKRALYWGKRKVKGNIITSNSKISLDYKTIPSPDWAVKGLRSISNIFNVGLGKGSDIGSVKNLQKLLSEVGLYDGEINGVYNNKIIDIIYGFQIENEIIKAGEIYGAGYWGKNTRALFLQKYLNGDFENEQDEQEQEVIVEPKEELIEKKPQVDLSVFDNAVSGKDDVVKLQSILKELSIYDGESTGVYKDIIDSIYDYQVSKGIVTSIYTPGAGNFGPKTRASLKSTYTEYLDNQEQEKQEKVKLEQEKKEQEQRKKELEEKYKHLEELSLKKAQEKLDFIGNASFGEVSHGVRELQITLKELGYYDYSDTAIFGNITKESIISYQLAKNVITSKDEDGAGLFGPITKETLRNDLKERFLQELVREEGIEEGELVMLERM